MITSTLYARFLDAASRYPQRPALMVKEHGHYKSITFAQLSGMVDSTAWSLMKLGLRKSEVVAIVSTNRPEWVITDLAAMKLGAVLVPIYPSASVATIQYMLDDSQAKLVVVENARTHATLLQTLSELSAPVRCIVIEVGGTDHTHNIIPFSQLHDSAISDEGVAPGPSPDDIATIVYTSGTTGEPKGVMLTHANIASNVDAMIKRYQISAQDVFLSYLPLCHMFERTCGYYAILFSGGTIAYAENANTVAADVLDVRPTVLLAVPRIIEKAFEHAVQEVSQNSKLKQWLVSATIKSLNTRADLRYHGQSVPWHLQLRCSVLDKTIAAKFRKIGGGRLRIIASGGAPLDRKIAKAYYVLGYNLLEGYGMTEASPVICSSSVLDNTLGTVGKPVPGVEVRIGDNEEVIAKGPNVMLGYLNKPEETANAVDSEGWLHTGDQGRFDAHGNLIITGRIKELIVTSYGKKIAAAAIEAKIARSSYVSQVMLCGDRRKFLVALIVPKRSAIEEYAITEGIVCDSYVSLLRDDRINKLVASEIEETTSGCSPYEKVKAFCLIPDEFSQADGLLTPLMKLRRKQVAERYANEIETLYETTGVNR